MQLWKPTNYANKFQNYFSAGASWTPYSITPVPSGICFPGTELLQSPFRTEFSMRSRSLQYRRSLRHHHRFLQSYRRSLWRCRDPWGDRRPPMLRRRLLSDSLNIVKHCDTSWTTSETSWTTSKTSWNTLKTLWNIMKHSSTRLLMRRYWTSIRRRRTWRGDRAVVIRCDDIGARCGDVCDRAELPAILVTRSYQQYWYTVLFGNCGVGITSQMCNRVTNHGGMGTFSKPDSSIDQRDNSLCNSVSSIGLCVILI